MPTSILTYRDRARSRLRENLRQAALAGADRAALADIVGQVRDGNLSFDAANQQVLDIRRALRHQAAA
jgi:hypothetical protein